MLGKYYKANTINIYEINNASPQKQFDDDRLADLDPNGWHILVPLAYGEWGFVKCMAYFKIVDDDKPHNGVIDVEATYLRSLTSVNHPDDFPKIYEGLCNRT